MVLVASCASSNSRAARVAPSSVLIEGEALAYVDIGQGRPIILVHGGFQDYRMWQPFLDGLASARRVIAYSRRNHSPNRTDSNGIPDYAADRHGQDLAALIRRLGLGQVDLVGHSSGASTVLFLAAQHPELVRSIVVVEPPLATMLTNSKEDQTSMAEFMSHLSSALAALRENDRSAAVRLFADAVGGPGTYERRTASQKAMMMANISAHVADARAAGPRPAFTCDTAGRIKASVLLINGTRSPDFFHRVADRLSSCLPEVRRLSIEASHTVPAENADAFERAVLSFLESVDTGRGQLGQDGDDRRKKQ
jgi:non-heme chloroperoxidase